ncbi:elongation factor P hydroxylase [Reinekea marinisedimentorum]|uniref:Elongation factor P hydroxylase n=1 Tax=Reinekea marinisedimentorum TaxID=230495 RepID=A0A4R3I4J4_9GAMM|nr:elongation factor P hydroxylase [Reinekea marinisedimentorum]TCS40816.1 hypothetical protein BCF53_108185 [Reinekea marinisedimentorum]
MIDHPLSPEHWQQGVDTLLGQLNPWLIEHWQTCLVASTGEPLYLPATAARACNEIHFAHGFFNSALHELAHWCVAGAERRKLEDYGYWYDADGRSLAQQKQFEQVEVYPQAIEWHLALACGRNFRISADNLALPDYDSRPFAQAVYSKAIALRDQGLPQRTQRLKHKLAQIFGVNLTAIEFIRP